MRILAVIPGDGQGNSFIFARRQMQSLLAVGVSVNTFYLKSRTSPISIVKEWLRLRRSIAEFSPDIVHAHYGTVTSLLCTLATNQRVVITFRGSDLNPVPDNSFLRNWVAFLFSQISALRASAIICTSGRLHDRLWWRKKISAVVPSGVNLALFRPCEKKEARRILGWKDNDVVILFNSGESPLLKGHYLAHSAVTVAEKKLGMLQFFQLKGDVAPEKMPMYLNAADCLLLTSEFEGSPNILKEALACNLPIVSVDVGDAVERLEGVFPSRVTPRDPSCLGQAICEVLEVQKRSNGREKILEYSDEKIAAMILDVYKRVCDELPTAIAR